MRLAHTAQKFGGTSMGSPQMIQQAGDRVEEALDEGNVIAVVSGMRPGERKNGSTDRLLRIGEAHEQGRDPGQEIDELMGMHAQLAAELGVQFNEDQYRRRIQEALEMSARGLEMDQKTRDALQTGGEWMMPELFAGSLRERGVDAEVVDACELILTDGVHGDATALMDETHAQFQRRLGPLLEGRQRRVIVTGGFYGTPNDGSGVITAFSRGGSDYSGSIAGAGVEAANVDICTDVPGIQAAHPARFPNAPFINNPSYRELLSLSVGGAGVVHPKAINPVMNGGTQAGSIPMRIVDTATGDSRTTVGWGETPGAKAVATIESGNDTDPGVTIIKIFDPAMIQRSGFANRITSAFASSGLSVDIIGTDNAAVSLSVNNTTIPGGVIDKLKREFYSVEVFPQHAAVTLVGSQLGRSRGELMDLFAVADPYDKQLLSMGTQHSVSLAVPGEQVRELEKAIYERFFEGR